MKEEDYSRAIEVFSGSPWEAEIIKDCWKVMTSAASLKMVSWGH